MSAASALSESHAPVGSGVVATRDELVRLLPTLQRLPTQPRTRVQAPLGGSHPSRFRGSGMDLAEVRAYQQGDDIRAIDWRVTARTGRAHSKVFEEEREQPVWLVVDLGASMRFGTRGCFKSVCAARAAALVAWAAHLAGERVGAIVLGPGAAQVEPPARTRRHVLGLLDAFAAGTARPCEKPGEALAQALEGLRPRIHTGSRVFVLSDFYALDEAAGPDARTSLPTLLRAIARRAALGLVWVHDPLEAEPPPPGRYRVTDGSGSLALAAGSPRWRQAYRERFERRRTELSELCATRAIELVPLRTDAKPAARLLASASLRDTRRGRA
jgi:uncharacterized protein (DUF58 family)